LKQIAIIFVKQFSAREIPGAGRQVQSGAQPDTSAAGSRDIARFIWRQNSFATPAAAVLD
jgi:hypothetical protein